MFENIIARVEVAGRMIHAFQLAAAAYRQRPQGPPPILLGTPIYRDRPSRR